MFLRKFLGLIILCTATFNDGNAAAQIQLIKYGHIDNSEFQQKFGNHPRPSKNTSPTFVIYKNAGWKETDILPQLKRADFLLQQCGIGIESPLMFYVESKNKKLSQSFFTDGEDIEKQIDQRIGFIKNHPALTAPIVLFLDNTIIREKNVAGWSNVAGDANEGAAEFIKNEPYYGAITISKSNVDTNSQFINIPKALLQGLMLITKQRYWNVENIHNVLAHELTHSLAALDHDTRGDKLMNTSASNGNFISEKFCEAMQRSPFLR